MKIYNKKNELIFDMKCLQGAYLRNADLWNAYLRNANLKDANLKDANLQNANLQNANLHNAILQDADLQHANLKDADLQDAYLQNTNLQDAYLRNANLQNADLRHANLQNADLRDADLWNANLQNANLRNADLRNTSLPNFKVCPPSGTFIAWKKGDEEHIIKLEVPSFARRTSNLKNRKCRAELVKVLKIYDKNGKNVSKCYGEWEKSFLYEVGKFVKPDSYCDDIRIVCSNGIHFFLTYDEVLNW